MRKWRLPVIVVFLVCCSDFAFRQERILDHDVEIRDGKLQPWTEYDNVLR